MCSRVLEEPCWSEKNRAETRNPYRATNLAIHVRGNTVVSSTKYEGAPICTTCLPRGNELTKHPEAIYCQRTSADRTQPDPHPNPHPGPSPSPSHTPDRISDPQGPSTRLRHAGAGFRRCSGKIWRWPLGQNMTKLANRTHGWW